MIQIDADALFRAVTATGYKLLAYHLNLKTGEINSRTLRPDEVQAAPTGSLVKPLPKMGGDLAPKKDASPFGPVPAVETRKKLFNDDLPKQDKFESDFFKRDEKKKPELFGDGGFKRESGAKRLAEIFGGPATAKKVDPFSGPPAPAPENLQASAVAAGQPAPPDDPANPRIPAAPEELQLEWMRTFTRNSGDPEIRDALLRALAGTNPIPAFEKLLRKHARTGQQWEVYFRKQALDYAEAWISDFRIQWELLESGQGMK